MAPLINKSHDVSVTDYTIHELKGMDLIPASKKTCGRLFQSAAITWRSKWRSS